ncbi:hypothetical protein F5B19DRAFT_23670 [Rostrohypoxylon terebratum]|nr:hypothetical protein F5B19DRAFT_23670 [Rostrohypoxylon terebratum]
MVRSLIMQLYEKRADTRYYLDYLYSQCKNAPEQPSLESLCLTFRDMIQKAGEVWIIIDAIDECTAADEDGVRDMISWIVELQRLQTDIHVLVTSRQRRYRYTIQDTEWMKARTDIVELLIKRGVNTNTQELVYDSDMSRTIAASSISNRSNYSASIESTVSSDIQLDISNKLHPMQLRGPPTDSEHPDDPKDSNQTHTKTSPSNDSTPLDIAENILPDQIRALDSMAPSNMLQSHYENTKETICPPQTIEDALQASNKIALRELISNRFDEVAIGAYSWLQELKEFGYSTNEIVDLISEQHNDSPWIFSQPTHYTRDSVNPNFHLNNCAHNISMNPSSLKASSSNIPLGSPSTTDNDHIARLVHELYGIAGVSPQSRDRRSWIGSVEFNIKKNAAFVSYGSSDIGYHKSLLMRIYQALSRLSIAVSKVQKLGLCCNCFTMISRSHIEIDSQNLVRLCRIPLSLVSSFLSRSRMDLRNVYHKHKGSAGRVRAAAYAWEILDLLMPMAHPLTTKSIELQLHLCALATQLLCVGFVSYAQAHTGLIHPFFLDMGLKTIYLQGTGKYPDGIISVELASLACIGDMIHDKAITFGLPQRNEVAEKKFVSVNIGDLLDTWGPGKVVILKDTPNHVSAIQLGAGVIWCSDREKRIFHWSRNPPEKPPEPLHIFPGTQLVIGSLVTSNQSCKIEIEQCWIRSVHHLEQLGTHKPYWENSQWQVGLQAGQYAVVQVNHTWSRIRGQTLKQCRLQQDDKTLVFFLEEPWGLQISYCTGVSRRVPLREVIADLLDIFLSVYNTTKVDRKVWEELKNLGIVEALRKPNFNDFLCQLDSHFNADVKVGDTITQMIRIILGALEPTGIHQGKLVVACFWEQEIFRCFKIPCENDHAWANVLADSKDCATFAYMSTRCLETKKIRCPKADSTWKNRILLMQTSIVLCSEPGPTPQSLKDKQIYFFDKFEREVFVLARKPQQAIAAELTMTSFLNTPRTIILRLIAKEGSNKYRGRIREMQKLEESAEPVFVL